jgi:hypothetical protein
LEKIGTVMAKEEGNKTMKRKRAIDELGKRREKVRGDIEKG